MFISHNTEVALLVLDLPVLNFCSTIVVDALQNEKVQVQYLMHLQNNGESML